MTTPIRTTTKVIKLTVHLKDGSKVIERVKDLDPTREQPPWVRWLEWWYDDESEKGPKLFTLYSERGPILIHKDIVDGWDIQLN